MASRAKPHPDELLHTFEKLAKERGLDVSLLYHAAERGELWSCVRRGRHFTTRQWVASCLAAARAEALGEMHSTVDLATEPLSGEWLDEWECGAPTPPGLALFYQTVNALYVAATPHIRKNGKSRTLPTAPSMPRNVLESLCSDAAMRIQSFDLGDLYRGPRAHKSPTEGALEVLAAAVGPRPMVDLLPRAPSKSVTMRLTRDEKRIVAAQARKILGNRSLRYTVAFRAFEEFGWDDPDDHSRKEDPSGYQAMVLLFYGIWCLEHDFEPGTGQYRRVRRWEDRLAVLKSLVVDQSLWQKEGLVGPDGPRIYKRLAREAAACWRRKLHQMLRDPEYWDLFKISDADEALLISQEIGRVLDRDRGTV